MSINIQQVPNAPGGYSLTGKKIMVHDQSAPLGSSTVMYPASSLGGGGGGSGTMLSDFWATTNGNAFINGASIENGYTLVTGDSVLLVFVEGMQFNIVSAAPGNRQCQLDLANNKIVFQDAFDGSQTVNVLFNRP